MAAQETTAVAASVMDTAELPAQEDRGEDGEEIAEELALVVQVDSSDTLEATSTPSDVVRTSEMEREREASVASRASSEVSTVQVSFGVGVSVEGVASEAERRDRPEDADTRQVGLISSLTLVHLPHPLISPSLSRASFSLPFSVSN